MLFAQSLLVRIPAASRRCVAAGVMVLAVSALAGADAYAQFEIKEMVVGSLAHKYSATGAEATVEGGRHMMWPAVNREQTMWYNGLWIAVRNFEDEGGREWPAKVAHATAEQTGQFFPQTFDMIARFPTPDVFVDGFETFAADPLISEIRPDMDAARLIENVVNSSTGITMNREVRAFSNEYHDNYHIIEYTLTNTGNTDDDEEIELPNQTLEGVYLFMLRRAIMPYGGANPIMFDYIGDGQQNYPTDVRALIQWQGNIPGGVPEIEDADPLGYPLFNDSPWYIAEGDSVGRLGNPFFTGTATLHADTAPGNTADDQSQPSTTGWFMPDDAFMTATQDDVDEQAMRLQYDEIAKGHQYPHQADVVDPDGDFSTPDGDPTLGTSGGPTPMMAYGPYTFAPGQSVKIVIAEAVDGLHRPEAMAIGREYKRLKTSGVANPEEVPIEFRGKALGKNDWFASLRDSLMQTFLRARANYESGYAIPEPPLPPQQFRVISGGNRIRLEWDVFDDATPSGFEIYRGRGDFRGLIEDNYAYVKVADLGPEAREYNDTTVVRGVDYFYYIQSVGDVNNDGTAMTPTGVRLRSNRYYTQTYLPANLKRPPPEEGGTTAARIVPNPYNIASANYVRWPGEQDRLGFLDIPGDCTIRIYTQTGELIKTIEHNDGSGDEFWNMTTEDRQLVVSGLYIAVIDNHENGERVVKKFVVIR